MSNSDDTNDTDDKAKAQALVDFQSRLAKTSDAERQAQRDKRHQRGFRTARENLSHLCDDASFTEYGQLAVAAQQGRLDPEELATQTAADGIITGIGNINGHLCHQPACAIAICDYSVLAGTQGYFHHHKLDRLLGLADKNHLPVILYTEGGGGRPGDTDVVTQIAGLNVPSFSLWASMKGKGLRIAVNNGYCFAGNAALFGAADIRIATRSSSIGMAGPAMIEGGGLGEFSASEIGPAASQYENGVIDLLADDEEQATRLAQQALSYFQGRLETCETAEQLSLRDALPDDRRYSYKIRPIVETVLDTGTFLELSAAFGRAMITGLGRINGTAVGILANDPRELGGTVDTDAAKKAARFIRLCNEQELPVIAFCDTPGFMVGPASEKSGAVVAMADLFTAGAEFEPGYVCVCLRKAYGLGAMAMAAGSFRKPDYICAWPSGEFGAMGLEGAVRLGFKKELEQTESEAQRQELFDALLAQLYSKGKAVEAARYLEIDAVIDPADTRAAIIRVLDN